MSRSRITDLGDIAGGEDVGDTGFQIFVRENAPLHLEFGGTRQFEPWARANRHRQDFAGNLLAVCCFNRCKPPTGADGLLNTSVIMQFNAIGLQALLDQLRLLGIEHIGPVACPAQEIVDVAATSVQTLGQLQGGNAATHDDRVRPPAGALHQAAGFVKSVERHHAVEVATGKIGRGGTRTRRQEQTVVRQRAVISEDNAVGLGVNPFNVGLHPSEIEVAEFSGRTGEELLRRDDPT